MENGEYIQSALTILKQELGPYVERQLDGAFNGNWKEKALAALPPHARRDGSPFDIQALVTIIWKYWNDVFKASLGASQRSLVSEIRDIRNGHAHQKTFLKRDTLRALDTVERLLRAIHSRAAEDVQKLYDYLNRAGDIETDGEESDLRIMRTHLLQGALPEHTRLPA
jgi:hypothetical protein